MPPKKTIDIDVSKLAAALLARLPTASDRERMLHNLAAEAYSHWKGQAQDNLKSTSKDYIAGLRIEGIKGSRAVISLVDGTPPGNRIPGMIEQGFKGGDMRGWMFNGPRAKTAKAGHKYLSVPFRHGVPGTTGRNVGRAMPPSIHRAAQKLTATLSRPGPAVGGATGRTTIYGKRLHPTADGVGPKARGILNHKEKPWHATSIYMGMIRKEKTYETDTQGQYTTFRTISQKVIRGARDENTGEALEHWRHPGIRPRHFARATQKHVKTIAARIVTSAMSAKP
jgi:hypothetical protein